MTNAHAVFAVLELAAMKARFVTEVEIELIVRPGMRKERYWGRHMRDLRAIIEQRLGDKPALDTHSASAYPSHQSCCCAALW